MRRNCASFLATLHESKNKVEIRKGSEKRTSFSSIWPPLGTDSELTTFVEFVSVMVWESVGRLPRTSLERCFRDR